MTQQPEHNLSLTKDRQILFKDKFMGSTVRFVRRMKYTFANGPVRVWRPWIFVEIGFLLAILALFNLFPQLIGISRSPDAVSEPLPLVAKGFVEHLAWLNLWWGLAIVVNLMILLFNLQGPLVRWARLALNLFGLFVLLRLVIGGPILSFNPAWADVQSANTVALTRIEKELAPILSLVESVALSMAILALGITSLQKIRLLKIERQTR
jgi:hypothetical protein